MLVVDTSAFVSLAVGEVLDHVLEEFDVVTTATVVEELEETAESDDLHGAGAAAVLDVEDAFTVVDIEGNQFETSRIDVGEASCVAAARELDAAFFVTDDYRALPELQEIVDAEVALSPIVLRSLVKRGVLTEAEAQTRFEKIAEGRGWLGAPIYRYARRLFD
ncbi:PIN domain-containing protein [Halolamina salifodinae]|uniref:Putative nucleic acid-binding protein n=1 Tax=Halolamina salifodinae TaxID=1202767 RepID=A0A8T4GZ29_9EURY|nr:PIN domain-containing protein [Halolamina salifodinae]MBP1986635.1 putative nucleic acid-binding protein [Halolamina salifodinae]